MRKNITIIVLIVLCGCSKSRMNKDFSTHLMFQGDAESALNLYARVFPEGEIEIEQRFGDEDPERAGKIKLARLNLYGQKYIIFDSPVKHDFGFTPAISIFVTLHDADEFDAVFQELGKDGKVFMPPDNYGFSTRFGWLQDKFGVSWQINLEVK
jgi:predicted 3-demethylubiquinone-9 3-methyltransferase (glyoxalase superfamily)